MRKQLTIFIALLLLGPALAFGQNVVEVTDADIDGDVVWTNDNEYVLVGRVFVENGETLTIEPGTVVKGRFSADPENAAALVVAQGGQLFANGTPTDPIIFTAEADDVDDPTDLGPTDRGLWGGVILLGRASINTADGTGEIEGIPVTEDRGQYGGGDSPDDADNSGVVRYVSIRHGGAELSPNEEINGFTMGAVGTGTTIEYVEVLSNSDDCFEWFGGTVNTRYLVGAFCGDDTFDYDEGFRGNHQFWFSIQSSDDAGSGGEHDGGTEPESGQPFSQPVIYNATFIGPGVGAGLDDPLINMRDNAGGKYFNSIFTAKDGVAIQVEDLGSGEDTFARFEAGQLEFTHNIFFDFGVGSSAEDLFVASDGDNLVESSSDAFASYMADGAQSNQITDPQLVGISRTTDGGLDPRPAPGSPALTSDVASVPANGFFAPTDYIGAFGPGNLWAYGWTALDELGVLPEQGANTVEVTDADIDGDVVWTNDNEYVLVGRVFVENGETLT
ncbi:MAG: T9SS C-terminal target domain-containing protein, partial [Bacteroidetes bacterium]|nr:T9SS C-terminal target domain-containing protein [Bacteroidota bacterium]